MVWLCKFRRAGLPVGFFPLAMLAVWAGSFCCWASLEFTSLPAFVAFIVSQIFSISPNRYACAGALPFKRKGQMAVLDVLVGWFSSYTSISLQVSPKFPLRATCWPDDICSSTGISFHLFLQRACQWGRFLVYGRGGRLCQIPWPGDFAALLVFPLAGWVCASTYISFHRLWTGGFAGRFWFLSTCLPVRTSDFPCFFVSDYACLMPCPDDCAALFDSICISFGPSLGQCATVGAFAGWLCSCNWKPSRLSFCP